MRTCDAGVTSPQRVTVGMLRREGWEQENVARTEDGSMFVELSGACPPEGLWWLLPEPVMLYGWACVCECGRVLPDLVRKCTCGRGQNCLDHEQ